MLQRVMRPGIPMPETASPPNSTARYVAPSAPMSPTIERIRSFGPTRSGNAPVTVARTVSGTRK